MKRISMIVVLALGLAFLVYAQNRTPIANSERSTSQAQNARIAAAQNRLDRYFQGGVAPKLRDCWNSVKGEGRIAIALSYTKSGSSWTWEKLKVTSSTLPQGQDAVALKCVEEAVRATSFPVDQAVDTAPKSSAPASKFLVNWSFPVPLPASTSIALARAAGGGSGSPASCWQCGFDSKGEAACEASRAGWEGCIERDLGGCICFGATCTAGGFVAGGGAILMRQ